MFELTTDNWPEDISWELTNDADNSVVSSGGNPGARNTLFTFQEDLAPGCYTFVINDSWGDGLTGAAGYKLIMCDVEIHSGDDYGDGDSHTFCVDGKLFILSWSPGFISFFFVIHMLLALSL